MEYYLMRELHTKHAQLLYERWYMGWQIGDSGLISQKDFDPYERAHTAFRHKNPSIVSLKEGVSTRWTVLKVITSDKPLMGISQYRLDGELCNVECVYNDDEDRTEIRIKGDPVVMESPGNEETRKLYNQYSSIFKLLQDGAKMNREIEDLRHEVQNMKSRWYHKLFNRGDGK